MAGVADDMRRLIDGAYAAALDDMLWGPWLVDLVGTFGGIGGLLAVVDAAETSIKRLSWHAPTVPPAGLRDYADHWGAYDPQVPVVAGLRRSTVYVDTDHFRDDDDPTSAGYMARSRVEFGWDHHLTGVVLLDDDGLRVGLSIHRGPAAGDTPVADRRKLQAIFPELRRAMALGFVHAEKLQESYWNGLVDGHADAALLLDERGRVIRMTAATADMLAAERALDVTGGRLRAADPADDAALQAMIGRALAPSPVSGAASIRRGAGRAPYVVTAYPLPRAALLLAPPEPAALVTIVDPAANPPARADLWRAAFGLTPREAELAALLMTGHSIESAAAVLTIAQPTARVHLRRVLENTRTVRQSELVRLLARVGWKLSRHRA